MSISLAVCTRTSWDKLPGQPKSNQHPTKSAWPIRSRSSRKDIVERVWYRISRPSTESFPSYLAHWYSLRAQATTLPISSRQRTAQHGVVSNRLRPNNMWIKLWCIRRLTPRLTFAPWLINDVAFLTLAELTCWTDSHSNSNGVAPSLVFSLMLQFKHAMTSSMESSRR